MRLKYIHWKAAVATISILSASLAFASINPKKTIADMADASSVVVTAKVLSTHTEYVNDQVMTKVRVHITDELKGDVNEFVIIDVPGGSAKSGRFNIGESGSNGHMIFSDDNALLFLNENKETNTFSLSNQEQGYTPIQNSSYDSSQQHVTIHNKNIPLKDIKTEFNTYKGGN